MSNRVDHLDGTALVMDSSGMVSRPRYYPYGMQWTQEGSAPPTDRLFTGQQRQGPNSGIYYYGARFYAADVGRFAEADTEAPLVPNGVPCGRSSSGREGMLTNGQVIERTDPPALNRYSYVINNPTNYVDPTGEFVWSTFGWENPAQWGEFPLPFDFGASPSLPPTPTPTPMPQPTPVPPGTVVPVPLPPGVQGDDVLKYVGCVADCVCSGSWLEKSLCYGFSSYCIFTCATCAAALAGCVPCVGSCPACVQCMDAASPGPSSNVPPCIEDCADGR